jgi:hypothetical protein
MLRGHAKSAMLHVGLDVWPLLSQATPNVHAFTVVVKVTDRASRRTANFLGAHFLRFRDDRIADYCAIIDSFDAARQLADD